MGLFNLFKKKGEDDNEPNPEDQMLTLKERQKPALKSDTKPPTAPPAAQPAPTTMLTPDPQINSGQQTTYNFDESPAPEPPAQEYLRENLSTKSLEKSIQSMPNVKKLVIPSNNEAMSQKVEATDTVIAERVSMKQVELQTTDKAESIAPESTNFIPGEFIDIPISIFTESIEEQYLSPNAKTLFDNSTKVRFTKDEVLSIMAQGAFSVVASALLARFPSDIVSEKGKSSSEVFQFPIEAVMSLIPPEWFALQGQDTSLNDSLNNMANPFQDLEEPVEEEKEEEVHEKTTEEGSSLFADDEEEEIEVSTEIEEEIDPLETIPQTTPPPTADLEIDPLETIPQTTPPPAPQEKAVTDDNTLVIDVALIANSFNPEIFSDFPQSAQLKIPRERVMKSLAEGVFNFTAKEIDNFAGTNNARTGKENENISVDLGVIMGLIPPEWFALQGQDNSQNDILTNMRDVFDDSTFEEAAKEIEQETEKESDLGETVFEENNLNAVTENEVPEEEVEVSVEAEEDNEDTEDSLITGGIFSKMNNLFEDDEEEDDEIEVSIESNEAEDTTATPEPEIEEKAEAVPLIEEEHPDTLQTVTINRDESKVFDDQRLLEEQRKEEAKKEAVETTATPEPEVEEKPTTIHSMPTLVQLTPPPKVPKPEEKPQLSPPPQVSPKLEPQEESGIDKVVANAGKVTYRPVNEDVPDMTDKAILRPSTAPNGIDINRSNLADLCRLHSAGEKLAQTLIEYREKNGDFKSVNELINVPGVGSSVYKSLTGLRPSADLVAAERRINKAVGLDTDKDYPLGKIISEAQQKFNFKSIILSDKDGFEICFSGDKSLLESNSELLAATTPQLFKRTRHFLKQSLLPHPEVFTFYLEDTPVTFGIADEVFMVMVHDTNWPEPKHMKQCRTLINELAWFCSYRAIV